MILYRVSRKKYGIGEQLWEDGSGEGNKNSRSNLEIFLGLIRENDVLSICNIFSKKDNLQFIDAYREAWCEFVRERKFPQFPARHKNMMLFTNKEDADFFTEKYRKNMITYIYEVETDSQNYFIGDMNMLDRINSVPELNNFNGYLSAAEVTIDYWEGKMTSNPIKELILHSGSKVIIKRKI